jgi:hypothetical protein
MLYFGLVCRTYVYDRYSYTEVAKHTKRMACIGDEGRPPYTVSDFIIFILKSSPKMFTRSAGNAEF